MNEIYLKYFRNLNNINAEVRLNSLIELANGIKKGVLTRPITGNDINNHIHTTYSFSPYSPTKAIWMAYNSGLATAGIMDHDSVSGAEEFIQAGRVVGIATTIGAECRADFSNTPIRGRSINNPDQKSIAYIALHGIPHSRIQAVKDFFVPLVRERNKRNLKMIAKINEIMKSYSINLDFENDVMPLSMIGKGGSITERHILFALSRKMVSRVGKGERLVDYLKYSLKIVINKRIESYLLNASNENYLYDLLGVLKSGMTGMIYVNAEDECPDVREVTAFASEIGCIAAYAYLGDIENSVTGDKQAQKFEDGYLDLLFETIKEIGFNAVTYMPSRNAPEQLKRIKAYCERYDMFQISGEDINQPRQSFVCESLRDSSFNNLIDSAWALIGHEKAASEDIAESMFSQKAIDKYPDLNERIMAYAAIGKGGDIC